MTLPNDISQLRVLVLEDSEDDALLLLHHLRKGGYAIAWQRVDTPTDLVAALEMQAWDVVIADYVMPQFTALEALVLVQGRELDIPFIVVSGVMGEETAVTVMRAGAHDYLLKDRLVRLVPAVERELREARIRREKRQTEAKLRQAYERLAIERMKDEFISVVSHELRTPLTSIRASLGLLLTGKLGTLPEECTQFLEIAVNNSDRLIRLINDILDLQSLDSGALTLKCRNQNLADLMRQAIETMQGLADTAAIQLQVMPLSVVVCVDGDRILQTLTNLLSNAIKFSGPDTVVRLTAELLPSQPPDLPARVRVAVIDQGRGIPSDQIDRIFGRFQQVDTSDSRDANGSGLGLAICRSIITQHGGTIWAESHLHQGSTFFFTLPLGASSPYLSSQPVLPVPSL